MRLTGRRWATAFVASMLAHAGVVAVVSWQSPAPGAGPAGPGVIRVFLDQAGGASASVATGISGVPEAEMVSAAETAAGPPIEEALSEGAAATPRSVETVDPETVTQAAAPDEAALVEPAGSGEASEPEAIAAAGTAAEVPVEEAPSASPEAAEQAVLPADTSATGVMASVEAPAGLVPVEAIEAVVRQAEDSRIPMTEATIAKAPDTETIGVAEAVTGPPIEEAIPTSPKRVAPAPEPADSIEAEAAARVSTTIDPAPPGTDVDLVQPIQPARDLPARRLVSAATGGPLEEAVGRVASASPPGESDFGRSGTPAVGSGARIETKGSRAAHDVYLGKVLQRIARFKRYPREARRDGVAGKVMVRFTVLADGSLESPQLTGSSGDSRLDRAALDMLSRASPFPPIPRSLGMDKLELSLPVQFSLSRKRTLF